MKKARHARVAVEELEPRNLLSIFTPAQIRHAYGFDQMMFGAVNGDGAGQTIAIVDAYDDPRIANDLRTFDTQFGLPAANFTKATPFGKPRTNAGWSLEISLDVEWAHSIAPGAKILLVEARTSSFTDLFNAVNYARQQPGVAAVSMSWRANEAFLGTAFETANDGLFTTPSGHTGVTFVASSGDDGGGPNGPEWPAISPNVLAVGGTSLFLDSQGNYSSESGWSGSTGGVSSTETEPSYQASVQSTGFRTSPDVSMVGDPNTGLYVYTTVPQSGHVGYFQVGGTSAGSPMWAALVAVADQGRAQLGTTSGTQAALDGATDTLPALYNLPTGDFNEVTTGSNKVASATVGNNQVVGLGTPIAPKVVADLLKVVAKSAQTSASVGRGSSQAKPHAVNGGGQSPTIAAVTASTTLDATVATALTRASVFTPPAITAAGTTPATNAPTPPAPIPPLAPMTTTNVTSMLILGESDATGDGQGVTGDEGPTTVPVIPITIPGAPAGMESQAVPERPMIDELYNDGTTESRWTVAFVASDVPVIADQADAETSVTKTSVALAVAMGGFWMILAERPARRARPELAN